MDFNDYRLFLAPEGLPAAPSRIMNHGRRSSESDLSSGENVDWLQVDVSEEGEVQALSPAETPTEDCDRMVRSLDLGHESLESDGASYSFPWQGRSRTLEDSPTRSSSNPLSNDQQTRSSDSERIKYKLLSAWNNMKFGR